MASAIKLFLSKNIKKFLDISLSEMLWDSKLRKYFEIGGDIGQDYYPEILGQLWILNVPWIFGSFWSIMKKLLSKTTIDKIKIFGNDYQKELHEAIGKENLPDYYGGDVQEWPNTTMPWTDFHHYCNAKKSFYNNDEIRCSDPLVMAEKIDFGANCDIKTCKKSI